jgi:hypothetical protein
MSCTVFENYCLPRVVPEKLISKLLFLNINVEEFYAYTVSKSTFERYVMVYVDNCYVLKLFMRQNSHTMKYRFIIIMHLACYC